MSAPMSQKRLTELEQGAEQRRGWTAMAVGEMALEIYRLRDRLEELESDETARDASALYPDVVVQLTGVDGNAFMILAEVTTAMRHAGFSKETIDTFRKEATSGDYEHLLRTCTKWVTVQ